MKIVFIYCNFSKSESWLTCAHYKPNLNKLHLGTFIQNLIVKINSDNTQLTRIKILYKVLYYVGTMSAL